MEGVTPTESKKILIIEDEKPIAHALDLKLSSSGFSTKVAPNGQEGLNILEKEKFDLILLDLIMPEKDGFFVLEALKKKGSVVPVMVLSNLSQEEDERRSKELGAKEFFIKSNTSIANIVEQVKQYLQ